MTSTLEINDNTSSPSYSTSPTFDKSIQKDLSMKTKSHSNSPLPFLPITTICNSPCDINSNNICDIQTISHKHTPLSKRKTRCNLFLTKKRRKRKHNKPQSHSTINPHKKANQTLKERYKIFASKILSTYSEGEYLHDKTKISIQNKAHQLMQKYFPSMYTHLPFYLYITKLKQRRIDKHNDIFIDNTSFTKSNEHFFLEKSFNDINGAIPKLIWSVPNKEINYNEFYEKCIQIWPFDKCRFIKEFSLEFLMKNNYDIDLCLVKLTEFVQFMQRKIIEHNIPLVQTDAKIKKNYNLRFISSSIKK